MTKLAAKLRAFRAEEDGAGTLEFILILPFYLILFTSAYEGGVLSTRHVMLERGLDVTVREVRIGRLPDPTNDNLSARICEVASIIPNCLTNIRLEMLVREPRNFANVGDIDCVDRTVNNQPAVVFNNTGDNNDLMILRACVLFDPMLPTSGLGKAIPKKSGSAYALVATSSYVMEPFQ
ncbi:TadE/TadG family type IV pilus assembly protein [Yoonia sp. R2331]|uniref:TadE/TadG family type IV pilus assembly protein n=1 Tax=Yoonia sp. R2331 TaxID=3237238 RepID=UPI0034E4D913